MTPYERSVRENLAPPGYDVWGDDGFGWSWQAGKHREDARMGGYHSQLKACLAAWDDYDSRQREVP